MYPRYHKFESLNYKIFIFARRFD